MIWLNPIELHGWYKLHNWFLSKVGKNSFLLEDFWLSSLQLNCKIQSPFFSKCNRQKVGYWSYCRLNCIAHHVKKKGHMNRNTSRYHEKSINTYRLRNFSYYIQACWYYYLILQFCNRLVVCSLIWKKSSHPNHHSVVRNIYLPHQDIGENTSYHIL